MNKNRTQSKHCLVFNHETRDVSSKSAQIDSRISTKTVLVKHLKKHSAYHLAHDSPQISFHTFLKSIHGVLYLVKDGFNCFYRVFNGSNRMQTSWVYPFVSYTPLVSFLESLDEM
ncbi:hypothetical protein [Erysipelothrix larvae]|uniref:hypothetical protein n=1 Tax=Erysipelothrix larvae TaxID=1514105 RepID=UPI0018E075A1|nr:hypothetical protein [Erysipelothrix larvae]